MFQTSFIIIIIIIIILLYNDDMFYHLNKVAQGMQHLNDIFISRCNSN